MPHFAKISKSLCFCCILTLLSGPAPFALFSSNPDLRSCPLLSTTCPLPRVQQARKLESMLPGVSPECIQLMKSMLTFSPKARITASKALAHPWFMRIQAPIKKAAVDFPKHRELSPTPYAEPVRQQSGDKCSKPKQETKICDAAETESKKVDWNHESSLEVESPADGEHQQINQSDGSNENRKIVDRGRSPRKNAFLLPPAPIRNHEKIDHQKRSHVNGQNPQDQETSQHKLHLPIRLFRVRKVF